jgi:hypothetical protein
MEGVDLEFRNQDVKKGGRSHVQKEQRRKNYLPRLKGRFL